ncbi:MAG: cupin-like domain-containing protein [Sphingomonas sp.]|nr:cupin-like domain-containing protein [Sphingomonas sp.]
MRQIALFEAPTPEQFRADILPRGEPAVLRAVASHWPLVAAGKRWMDLLAARANDQPVEILRSDPDEQGRFHYSADGRSLNFVRGRASLPTFLAALREQASEQRPYAMVAQGLVAERHVPGFAASHPMPLVPASALPRLWIGNAAKVATHNDPAHNVAVVAAGRRRFTLFPPSAQDDLYMGPAHPTPAGTPVSMVHVTAPDLNRFPRFASALRVGQEAELGPGDAIFIPKDWFHHVETLEPFNLLVNYWWSAHPPS